MNEPEAPLVSVIMIFWNSPRFMDEAIHSVVDQTHPKVEVLLCDDGSTDSSTDLARAWVGRHPDRIRYLEHADHAHRGMGATRNLGLAHAQGDLVAFLDVDDTWHPDHLQRQLVDIEVHPEAGAVCGVALDWHSWQDTEHQDVWSRLPWPSGTVASPPDMLTAVLQDGGFATPICSFLVRRSAITELGGFVDAFTGMYEDQVILARLYLTQPVVLTDARTAYYRQHEDSSTARAIRHGVYHPVTDNRSREAFLHWLNAQPQLQSLAAADSELRQAMRSAMRPYRSRYSRLRWRMLAVLRRLRQAARMRIRRGSRH